MHLGVTMPTHMWLQFDWLQAEVSEIKPSIWQLYSFLFDDKIRILFPFGALKGILKLKLKDHFKYLMEQSP